MRKTPEIPQDVFFDEPKAAPAPKPAKPQAVTTAKVQAVKTARPRAVKAPAGQKVQITIYLTDEAAKSLERARFELLSRHNLRIPKSSIAEYAITRAVQDLDALAQGLAEGTAD